MQVNDWSGLKTLLLLLLLFPAGSHAQTSIALGATRQEQSVFNADPSEQVTHPIRVPNAVLQLLAKDTAVAACMKDNPIAPGGSLTSWFTASEIHLNGPDEADLVVLPVAQGDAFMCFHSVEGVGWFWVFREAAGQYELVLKTAGLGLSVLDTRHNGYKDIRSDGQVGKWSTRTTFRFTGGRYQEFQKKTTELK
jgi:hypothetical protein